MERILNTYTSPELKRMIRATNITGYSKLKKDQLIKLMMRPEHRERFKSIRSKIDRQGQDLSKVNREFKKKAKIPRKKFELQEESKKIQVSKATKGKKGSKEI